MVEVAKKQWGRRRWRITERKKKKKTQWIGDDWIGNEWRWWRWRCNRWWVAPMSGSVVGDEWRRWVDRWPVMSGIWEWIGGERFGLWKGNFFFFFGESTVSRVGRDEWLRDFVKYFTVFTPVWLLHTLVNIYIFIYNLKIINYLYNLNKN